MPNEGGVLYLINVQANFNFRMEPLMNTAVASSTMFRAVGYFVMQNAFAAANDLG